MSAKSSRKPALKKARPQIDHLQRALLMLIARFGPSEGSVDEHIAAARQIMAHPNPFTQEVGSPCIEDVVLHGPKALVRYPEDQDAQNQLLDAILNNESLDRPRTDFIKNLLYIATAEAEIVGAALMYELLKGGAR
jgi:hypothetical protein